MKQIKDLKVRKTVVDNSMRETKSHGTPEFPLGVYLDDFSDFENGYICWHWHEQVQLSWIVEGDFLCQIEAEEVLLHPGDIIFFNEGRLHQIKPCKKGSGVLYSFVWKAELLHTGKHAAQYDRYVAPVCTSSCSFLYWRQNRSDEIFENIESNIRQIVTFYEKQSDLFELKIMAALLPVWCEIYTGAITVTGEKTEKLKREEQRVKDAIQFMEAHYQDTISLEQIADSIFVSKSELCRSFQKILQITPMDFLMPYRVRQAAILLRQTDKKIAEIAEQTGFCSPSHFGSHFRKEMGCSPREYRKEVRGDLYQ